MLGKIEKLILKAMYQEHRPMSIREIADKASVSWITVRKHLKSLLVKQYVKMILDRKRKYFIFNYSKVEL